MSPSLLIYTARPPQIWRTVEEAGMWYLTPSPRAHILLVSSRRQLLFHPFAQLMNLEDSLRGSLKHVHRAHTGFIIRKHLPKATEGKLSTLMRDRRGGSEGGEVPPGRTLRSNDTPGLPLSRCSTNQTIPVPQGMMGKIPPHLPRLNEASYTLNPQGTPGKRKAKIRP